MKEFEVAVVGAGPAGSSTAISLAQQGYHVALIDRAVFPRDKLCGDFLNPLNWPVLDENVSAQITLVGDPALRKSEAAIGNVG